jgi:hypothetical protein
MGETFLMQCSTVPTVIGSEVRFSLKTAEVRQIKSWPLRYISCEEITPPQSRLQWGVNTYGARLDSYKALRLGSDDYSLQIGMRSTNSNSHLRRVEEQRVGVATLTLAGQYKLSYWNDHAFWWWPMGGGSDQGDTAGLSMSYGLGNRGFPLLDAWQWRSVNVAMRLATGIPDKKSVVTQQETTFYSQIEFSGIDRGDIDLNTVMTNRDQQILTVGLWVNSGELRNLVQSKAVHKSLDIPELPKTYQVEVMLYLKLEQW